MFKKNLLLILILCAAACSPARPTQLPTPAPDQINTQEQAVYTFLLAKLYQHKGYVIMANTATSATGVDNTAQTLDYVLQNMHAVDPTTLDSFRALNATAQILRPDMQLGGSYTLLSQTARNLIFLRQDLELAAPRLRVPTAPTISRTCCGLVTSSGVTSASRPVGFTLLTAKITFRRHMAALDPRRS